MGEESPGLASAPTGAVFLSYASQDAEAARLLCEALRAAGIEVWFDQSELRGGDAWDQMIRKQIKTCALFIPVISRHTHERVEGYFRLEWKLAVDRSHLIMANKAFLLPVVIDHTSDHDEHVPDTFHDVQWTRLTNGETPPAFVEWIKQLLTPDASPAPTMAPALKSAPTTAHPVARSSLSKASMWGVAAIVAVVFAYLVADKFWLSRRAVQPRAVPIGQRMAPPASTTTAFNPPPHSIAVLPFVNMSGDKDQEYFSDGLTEELLNSLASISELQVVARTSTFSFKGKDIDIGTIARKLNVGAILEGSVRRSAHMVRITARLDDAVTGFHLWSHSYDRDLHDVLKLQSEIANSVASAMRVTLLSDVANRAEPGGTRVPAALDAYLRATGLSHKASSEKQTLATIEDLTEALRVDPAYARAYAFRSTQYLSLSTTWATGTAVRDYMKKARIDAQQAIDLAPQIADGHLALAFVLEPSYEFAGAAQEYQHALTLAPGVARVLRLYGLFAVNVGHRDEGLAAVRRAIQLDPLNSANYASLGVSLRSARRYDDALRTFDQLKALDPDDSFTDQEIGITYYSKGDLQNALRACSGPTAYDRLKDVCLSVAYDKLGRHSDAQAILSKAIDSWGDSAPAMIAMVYAQRGDAGSALGWLEKAFGSRDAALSGIRTEPLFDPLRKEPRFQAIEKAMKFPD